MNKVKDQGLQVTVIQQTQEYVGVSTRYFEYCGSFVHLRTVKLIIDLLSSIKMFQR